MKNTKDNNTQQTAEMTITTVFSNIRNNLIDKKEAESSSAKLSYLLTANICEALLDLQENFSEENKKKLKSTIEYATNQLSKNLMFWNSPSKLVDYFSQLKGITIKETANNKEFDALIREVYEHVWPKTPENLNDVCSIIITAQKRTGMAYRLVGRDPKINPEILRAVYYRFNSDRPTPIALAIFEKQIVQMIKAYLYLSLDHLGRVNEESKKKARELLSEEKLPALVYWLVEQGVVKVNTDNNELIIPNAIEALFKAHGQTIDRDKWNQTYLQFIERLLSLRFVEIKKYLENQRKSDQTLEKTDHEKIKTLCEAVISLEQDFSEENKKALAESIRNITANQDTNASKGHPATPLMDGLSQLVQTVIEQHSLTVSNNNEFKDLVKEAYTSFEQQEAKSPQPQRSHKQP